MEAPELYHSGYYQQCTPERRHTDPKPGDHFIIEDLLDFSNEDDTVIGDGTTFDNATGNSTDSSIVTVVDSCNSSLSGYDPNFSNDLTCRSFPEAQFSSDLCVPYDDLAELEWLSNIVEESFSSEDLQKLQLISGMKARTNEAPENNEFQPEATNQNDVATFRPEMSVPGKARSKRSRAALNKWSSRLLVLSPTTSSTSESDIGSNNSGKTTPKGTPKKKEIISDTGNSDGRRCLHCATDKTPQWRTGPMGPKTLCNACGVRYKSGRLVPEYRPASSPTFVLAQHSNSHRKVLELRRQKEMQESPHHHHRHHQQQHYLHPNTMFEDSGCDDYLIHHHTGPDYRQLI